MGAVDKVLGVLGMGLEFIDDHPFAAVVALFGLGFLLGLFFG